MSRSKSSLSRTSLHRILTKEVLFDPRKPGPMKPIVEANNPAYYKIRAKEAIDNGELILAMRLLALAQYESLPREES